MRLCLVNISIVNGITSIRIRKNDKTFILIDYKKRRNKNMDEIDIDAHKRFSLRLRELERRFDEIDKKAKT